MQHFSNAGLRRIAVGASVACAVAFFATPVMARSIAAQRPSVEFLTILFLAGMAAAFYPALIIREFARLMACKLIGWDAYLLRIWPFVIRLEPLAARLGSIPGKPSAGCILAFPPTPKKQSKWRVAAFNNSGAIADFACFGAIDAIIVAALPQPHLVGVIVFAILTTFCLVGMTSLGTAQKDEPLSHFGIACLRALGLRVSGIMPGQWDCALVEALEKGADTGAGETDANLRSADIYLYEHYFDLGEYQKAREALDRVISRTQPVDTMWNGLCIENAFFAAFAERNIALAEDSLAKVKDAKLRRYYHYRQALAAIAIARGDGVKALRLLRRRHRSRYAFSGDFQNRIHALVVGEARRLVSR